MFIWNKYDILVGTISEKMFTSGRKCIFFHNIAQYDANAGIPDSQHFWPPAHFFAILSYSGAIFMSSQLLKNLTIFNFAQNSDANSYPGETQLCQVVKESVKYFSSYAPPQNWNFTHKIGFDRYITSLCDQ